MRLNRHSATSPVESCATPSSLVGRAENVLRACLYRISPLLLVQYRYRRHAGKWFDPSAPASFDEKLLWLMLYWRHPLKSRCADKYAVRSYLEDSGLGHMLPKLLGVYSTAREIDFNSLPERFVLKATHGSGFNIVCSDKDGLDVVETRRMLEAWLKIDISKYGAELHYASMVPRIVCEEFLEEEPGRVLTDYKVYCFHGRAHCTMVCTERSEKGALFDFYDLKWERKLPYSRSGLLADRRIAKPRGYEKIIEAAQTLSKPFPFVRVDFYSVKGRAVFGELTFTPHGCIDADYTEVAQTTMGRLITLPEPLT